MLQYISKFLKGTFDSVISGQNRDVQEIIKNLKFQKLFTNQYESIKRIGEISTFPHVNITYDLISSASIPYRHTMLMMQTQQRTRVLNVIIQSVA